VLDPKLKRRVIKEGLRLFLHDNAQAWEMDSTGNFAIKPSRRIRACAQEALLAALGEGD
jgi:polyphosphate kinase